MKPAPGLVTAPSKNEARFVSESLTPVVAPSSTKISAQPPTCLGCGKRLHVTPDAFGSPSIDAMNWFSGVPYCQACLLRGDAA
jgi:hypothetical protein